MERGNLVDNFIGQAMSEKERKLIVSLGVSSSKCLHFRYPNNGQLCTCVDSIGTVVKGDCVLCDGTGFLGGYKTEGLVVLTWLDGVAMNIKVSEDLQRIIALTDVGSSIYFPLRGSTLDFTNSFNIAYELDSYHKVDVNIEEAPLYKKLSLSNLYEFGALEGAFTYSGDLKPRDCFVRVTPKIGIEVWQVNSGVESYVIRDIKTYKGNLRLVSPSSFLYNTILFKIKSFIDNGDIILA